MENLPFSLTGAQKKVYEEICADMEGGFVMNRLVQGDVGSGKTIVAVLALLEVVKNGYQGAFMVPTEVLAAQHYQNLTKLLADYGVTVGLLSGSLTAKEKKQAKSKPLHFVSSDGFHMYVGKNNLQNEELTFHFANGGDWWFHAKKAPGSHVIVKTNGEELPDRTFEEAARLAAHYSKNSGAEKVEVDYVEKKQVKKPNGSKPGFVVYYTNYSMMIDSDISGIQEVQ